jgi:hypothetical protein
VQSLRKAADSDAVGIAREKRSKGANVARSKGRAKSDKALYERLRMAGVRRKVARETSRLHPDKDGAEMKAVRRVAADLNLAADDIKGLVTRGPRKRSEAARKGAKTRKKNTSAKKAAKNGKKP